ncbi:Clavaminate synthase-like protein [Penicillium citrinum]|uniref:Clavaminate synthase-like protein n=1 Tax=Penicillium citrinum TaxID=5077 RepID=A0A9W9TJ47_PENCI|nr:Clavaminate synthase-like protein [Penicillium citrinum]KAJ5224613.1 Clavaminate synthase-like protein [Penicillium citrinum]
MSIESLDFLQYCSNDSQERQQFCHDLCETLSIYGFVKLRNSSLSKETIDHLFGFNKLFFDLPNNIKAKAAHSENPNPHRGWSAIGQESVWQISKFEQGQTQNERYRSVVNQESFDQGAADDKLFLNRWVDEDDLPGFRQFMEGVYREFHALHAHLLRAITAGLGLSEERLISKHQSNTSELRLLHYPSIPCSSMVSVQRIGEHSDFGTPTLLLQDSVGGLQVEDQQMLNSFIPVESKDVYEVIANVGDCLQRWTNKSLRSANHRVSLPEGKDAGTDEMLELMRCWN